ncbi:hypothetical protein [uncultured Microbulbifer sp.]|uniref:hypothetical protein n=1 Tax=uncultured Microbulbifer sp. TaxID=348147 RepID=UPI0026146B7C|nr:hypothetical protein [uncultured Microbulbifer sp.]
MITDSDLVERYQDRSVIPLSLSRWFFLGVCLVQTTFVSAVTKTNDWVEDIDYFHQELEKSHINLYHTVSKVEFAEKLAQLKSRLPSLSENQLLVEMMRVSRLVGDGHTQLAFWNQSIDIYPFQFSEFDGDLRLVATSEPYRHLLGYKLTAIDGTPAGAVVTRLTPIVQGVENEHSLKRKLAFQINVA